MIKTKAAASRQAVEVLSTLGITSGMQSNCASGPRKHRIMEVFVGLTVCAEFNFSMVGIVNC